MEEKEFDRWEGRIRTWAGGFRYPGTPDVAARLAPAARVGETRPRLRISRPALVLAIILSLLVGASLSVPSVRAAVLEFLQLGAVRIFQSQPTVSPSPQPAGTPGPAALVSAQPSPSASATPADLLSLLDLDGGTSLEEARKRTGLPIRLPDYPPDLGQPQRVFVQDMEGWVVILAWTSPGQPEQVRLSLHMISPGSFAVEKVAPVVVRETEVNGQPALWTSGPYIVRLARNGGRDFALSRLVQGHVLIWVEQGITYRLEIDLPLEEALQIAESLP